MRTVEEAQALSDIEIEQKIAELIGWTDVRLGSREEAAELGQMEERRIHGEFLVGVDSSDASNEGNLDLIPEYSRSVYCITFATEALMNETLIKDSYFYFVSEIINPDSANDNKVVAASLHFAPARLRANAFYLALMTRKDFQDEAAG